MPVTTDTQLFALRTLNKEQLIKKILELQDDMEDLYDEDGVCMSTTYQELNEEHEQLKEKKDDLYGRMEWLEELLDNQLILPDKEEIDKTWGEDPELVKELYERYDIIDYNKEDIDYYDDAGRRVILKDGRECRTNK